MMALRRETGGLSGRGQTEGQESGCAERIPGPLPALVARQDRGTGARCGGEWSHYEKPYVRCPVLDQPGGSHLVAELLMELN